MAKKISVDTGLNGRLTVDRGYRNDFGGREGSFTNKSYNRLNTQQSASTAKIVTLGFLVAIFGGGGAFYLSNPTRASDLARTYLITYGLIEKPELVATNHPSVSATDAQNSAEMIDVTISSTPSGAPIEIDGIPQGEVTPATIKLEKNRNVKLTVRLAGYLPSPYEEKFEVTGGRMIDVKFKSDKKGFVNVMVKGEGQIYINDKLVATTSPARMIAVPADEDMRIVAFDPKTKASDQQVIVVAEGATKTIMLTPRASAPAPASLPPTKTR